MDAYTGCDLQACARLLSTILQREIKRPERRACYIKRKRLSPVAFPVRSKPRRLHRKISVPRKRVCEGCLSEDSIDTDIRRIVEIKHQLQQPPVLNHEVFLPGYKSTTMAQTAKHTVTSVPYNQRLPSSTPQTSPPTRRKAESHAFADEHALNSSLDGDSEPLRPQLVEGHVQYQPRPQNVQRGVFSKHHQEGMRDVLIDNLKPVAPPTEQTGPEFSMYSEEVDISDDKPTRDTDFLPTAKPLRRPISPFKANKVSRDHREQATAQSADLSKLSRAQLLQAALKVALETGGLDGIPAFQRTGPISPFRPGTKGFSAVSRRVPVFSRAPAVDTDTSTLVSESTQSNVVDARQHEDRFRRHEPVLSESVADLHIPDKPPLKSSLSATTGKSPKKLKSSKSESSSVTRAKAPTPRGKKTQPKVDAKTKAKLETTKAKRTRKAAAVKSSSSGQALASDSADQLSTTTAAKRTTATSRMDDKRTSASDARNKVKRDDDTADVRGYSKPLKAPAGKVQHESDRNAQLDSRKHYSEKENQFAAADVPHTGSTTANLAAQSIHSGDGKENRATTDAAVGQQAKHTRVHNERRVGQEILDTGDNVIDDNHDVDDTAAGALKSLPSEKYLTVFAQLKHLTRELKAVPGIKLDKEGKRLMKELDDKVTRAHVDLQTDVDLAVQPVRTENAQLRRRIRILTQQLKVKDDEIREVEKPDMNFTLVQLQMQNYNLDNELKAQRQVSAKLKEEVQMYRAELDKLLCDKTSLLTLTGNNGGSLMTSQLLNENSALKSQADEIQAKCSRLERDNDALNVTLQRLNVDYKQKQQELTSVQELVRALQESMRKLVADMQSDGRSSTAVTAQARDVSSLVDRLSPGDDGVDAAAHHAVTLAPSTAYHSSEPSTLPPASRHHATAAGDATPTNLSPVYTNTMRHNIHSPQHAADNFPTPGSHEKAPSTYAATDVTEYHLVPGTSPVRTTNAFDQLDPLIKDMLRSQRMRRHQLGDSGPMSTDPFKPSARPGISAQSAAVGVSAAVDGRGAPRTEPEMRRDSTSTGPTVKELLTPLADRMQRFQTLSDTERSRAVRAINFDDDAAPPRALLQAPASRYTLQHQLRPAQLPAVYHADRPIMSQQPNYDATTAPAGNRDDDDDDSYTKDIKRDLATKLHYDESSSSTLMTTESSSGTAQHEHVTAAAPNSTATGARLDEGESRYSVTDYFQKYPDAANKSGRKQMLRQHEEMQEAVQSDAKKTAASRDHKSKMIDSAMHDRIGKWAEQVVFSPSGVPMLFDDNNSSGSRGNSESDVNTPTTQASSSPQVELYRGTDLDTSLSTIDDRTMSCDRDSAVTSGSVSSVDDRIFRQGLANLDANIERVQKSLQKAMI